MGWTQLARDFIFDPKNNRAKRFVKEIKAYKVQAEQQLKF